MLAFNRIYSTFQLHKQIELGVEIFHWIEWEDAVVTFGFVNKGLPRMAFISPVFQQLHSYVDEEGLVTFYFLLLSSQSSEGVGECPPYCFSSTVIETLL